MFSLVCSDPQAGPAYRGQRLGVRRSPARLPKLPNRSRVASRLHPPRRRFKKKRARNRKRLGLAISRPTVRQSARQADLVGRLCKPAGASARGTAILAVFHLGQSCTGSAGALASSGRVAGRLAAGQRPSFARHAAAGRKRVVLIMSTPPPGGCTANAPHPARRPSSRSPRRAPPYWGQHIADRSPNVHIPLDATDAASQRRPTHGRALVGPTL